MAVKLTKSTRQVKGATTQASDREVVYRDADNHSYLPVMQVDDEGTILGSEDSPIIFEDRGDRPTEILEAIRDELKLMNTYLEEIVGGCLRA